MEITVKFTVEINTNNQNISRMMEILMQNMMQRAVLRAGHKQLNNDGDDDDFDIDVDDDGDDDDVNVGCWC